MSVRRLRSDSGGEFFSQIFQKFLKDKDISHELAALHWSESNGKVEMQYRTLLDMGRSMLQDLAHFETPNALERVNEYSRIHGQQNTKVLAKKQTKYLTRS